MSQSNVIEVLNHLLADQRFSLVNYLEDARPWAHHGSEALLEATHQIVEHDAHYARRLADAITERDGNIDSGTFPMSFFSLNDLALDYLLAKLIESQRLNLQAHQLCIAELSEDPLARSLASEVVGSERAHLDTLQEFLQQTEVVLSSRATDPAEHLPR